MERREALGLVAFLLGGTIIGADAFLSGCKTPARKTELFDETDILFLDEVGDTILPSTSASPGAKEARIGEFMKTIVTDCYTPEDQAVFTAGIPKLNEASHKKFGKNFMGLEAASKHALLVDLDKEARDYNAHKKGKDSSHYFAMMKQLTIWGYFTSETGATKALRYLAVPGHYDGNYPYKKGDKAWAI